MSLLAKVTSRLWPAVTSGLWPAVTTGLWAVAIICTLYAAVCRLPCNKPCCHHSDSACCWSLSPNALNECFWPAPQQQLPPPLHHILSSSSSSHWRFGVGILLLLGPRIGWAHLWLHLVLDIFLFLSDFIAPSSSCSVKGAVVTSSSGPMSWNCFCLQSKL